MLEKDIKFFEQSLTYAMEKTAIYCRLKGAQFFASQDFDITLDQFCVLEVLSYTEDVCQRDISKKILKDRSNTSRILNILEEKELLERKVDIKQKRLVKKVYLTPKGKALLENIFPKVKEEYMKALDGISEEDIAMVKRILEKMRENLIKDTTIQI
ncbi:MAG: MarR family transcriptional regulator [bacterium]